MVHGENAFFAVPNCSAACEGVLRSLRGELNVSSDCSIGLCGKCHSFQIQVLNV